MSEQKLAFRLTGGKAIAAILVLFLFAGYKMWSVRQELETDGREVITAHIRNEMIRGHLDQEGLAMQDQAKKILALEDADIVAMSAHGNSEDMVVKVELAPDPKFPPGAELIRYYRMEHHLGTGWRVRYETDAWAYWLKVF